MTPQTIHNDESTNPLDNVEDLLVSHNWMFNRVTDDELIVDVAGKIGNYRLLFIWQEDMNALQFCAQMDIKITDNNMDAAHDAIRTINQDLWMGHFDLPHKTLKPNFRHTALFRGATPDTISEMIEDTVDIALTLAEKNYPIFVLLSGANDISDQNLSLAMMETIGES